MTISKKLTTAAFTTVQLAAAIGFVEKVPTRDAINRACVKVSEMIGLTAAEEKLLGPHVSAVLRTMDECPEIREHILEGAKGLALVALTA